VSVMFQVIQFGEGNERIESDFGGSRVSEWLSWSQETGRIRRRGCSGTSENQRVNNYSRVNSLPLIQTVSIYQLILKEPRRGLTLSQTQ
jgi:hypothetical protein